jgi:hypothetical protein
MSAHEKTLVGTEAAKAIRDRLREEGGLKTTQPIGVVEQTMSPTERKQAERRAARSDAPTPGREAESQGTASARAEAEEASTHPRLTPYEQHWGLAEGMEAVLLEMDHVRALGMARARAAKARLEEQANPKPVTPTEKQQIITEEPADGRGKTGNEPQRALTRAEDMYRAKPLQLADFDEYNAAGELRNLYFMLLPPSEGVSNLDQSERADPARKADRKARRLTGFEILQDGTVIGARRRNDDPYWRFKNAIFAMAGEYTDDGQEVIDWEIVDLMLSVVIDTAPMACQKAIGKALTGHSSDKQQSAAGAAFIKVHLRRLALHFQLAKVKPKRR